MVNDTPNKMNDDGLYPPPDISATLEDIHYQENMQHLNDTRYMSHFMTKPISWKSLQNALTSCQKTTTTTLLIAFSIPHLV